MATPVVCCGGECGQLMGSSLVHLYNSGTGPTFSTTTVRSGDRSLRFNTTAAAAAGALVYHTTNQLRVVGRFYVQFATLPSADTVLARTAAASGPCVRFKQSDSKIYAAVDTTLGATGATVTTGTWYRIDFDSTISGAGNDTMDVQVDGTVLGQATAVGASAGGTVMIFGMVSAATGDVFFDDLLISLTAADYPLGAGYVNHFVPTSDGTHNVAGAADFKRGAAGADILNSTTDAYLLVDEVPLDDATVDANDYINLIAPPNATDYVEVKYGPAPGVGTPTTGPRAVEVILGYAAAGTGAANVEYRLNDNGTTNVVYTATAVAGVTTNKYASKHYATAPSTSAAWTSTLFNNLRMRFGSPAAVDAVPDSYFTCTMIEAEFEAAVAAAQIPPDLMHRGQMPALLAQ